MPDGTTLTSVKFTLDGREVEAFQGETNKKFDVSEKLTDLHPHELLMMAGMIVALVAMGLYPQPVIDTLAPAISSLQNISSPQTALFLR